MFAFLGSIAGAVGATAVYPIDLGRRSIMRMVGLLLLLFFVRFQ